MLCSFSHCCCYQSLNGHKWPRCEQNKFIKLSFFVAAFYIFISSLHFLHTLRSVTTKNRSPYGTVFCQSFKLSVAGRENFSCTSFNIPGSQFRPNSRLARTVVLIYFFQARSLKPLIYLAMVLLRSSNMVLNYNLNMSSIFNSIECFPEHFLSQWYF